FTYTLNDHPYIDTSWGYQVLVALSERAAGPAGIVLFHELLLLGTFLLMWRTAMLLGGSPWIGSIFLIAAAIACEMRFEARPELLSLFFLALVLHILTRREEGLRAGDKWLPAIFLVWANCHSFFVLGWAAIVAVIVGGWMSRGEFNRRLVLLGVICVAVCICNPYGLTGVLFPFSLLTRFDRSNVFSNSIGELMSPFSLRLTRQSPFYAHWSIWTFRLLTASSLLSAIQLIRQRRFAYIIIWLVYLAAAARLMRNMPLFVVAALPAMIAAYSVLAKEFVSTTAIRATAALTALLALCLAARTVTNAYYLDDRRCQRFGCSWDAMELPVEAAEFVRQVELHGPMFNHMNLGGYWMWAQADPVFIDGRLEVLGEDFYTRYREMLTEGPKLESAAQTYGFRYAVFPFSVEPNLLARLSTDTRWRLAYFDHIVAIYIRSSAATERWIDPRVQREAVPARVRIDSLPGLGGPPRERGLEHWLRGIYRPEIDPEKAYGRGVFHLFTGDPERAAAEFAEAIQLSHGAFYEAYFNLASVLSRMDRHDEAKACYRIVLEDDPFNRAAQQHLSD
ncbi:MAG TPA: tetratricopeptide repeat protein, partial [Phycisphaerae bacterium]|nr:tetratricopeptide repeat protein [Phycisphaerae bacterium]